MLTDSTKRKLELFAKMNNWEIPHPLDMERFWSFIIEAYNSGEVNLVSEDFESVIKGRSIEEIQDWVKRYEEGIGLLQYYNK